MSVLQKLGIQTVLFARRMKHQTYPLLYSVFGFVSVCHHSPSCSEYTVQQIQRHGTIRGLYKGLIRVIHCY